MIVFYSDSFLNNLRSQLKDITIENLKRDLDERYFKDRDTIEDLQKQLDDAKEQVLSSLQRKNNFQTFLKTLCTECSQSSTRK